MFVALRSGLTAKSTFSGIAKELCKIHRENNVYKYQVANLTRASLRNEDEIPLMKPFPYHEKEYNLPTMLWDVRKCRLHKHSQIISIDGPVASGKNKLAKQLAKEFDFLYLPPLTFDDLYKTPWGFDVRSLDNQLPKNIQTWDIERFLQNPKDLNTAMMQMYSLLLRQRRYIDALAHIFCTGQGVVTVRTPWSDKVFAKAMYQSKYISPKAYEAYVDSLSASESYYLRPHLIIYLDVPVKETQQNIKKRGLSHEINSKALTTEYLTNIEQNYKKDYLTRLGQHSHLLIYDWSDDVDVEGVVDDIEALDFHVSEIDNPKLEDWRLVKMTWKIFIRSYTYKPDFVLRQSLMFRTDVPELLMSGEEMALHNEIIEGIPDFQYAYGYNILKGDKDILLKTKHVAREDFVTPLMKKYYERKAALKQRLK